MTRNGRGAVRRLLTAAAMALLAGCSGQYWVDDRGVVVDPDPTVITTKDGERKPDRDRKRDRDRDDDRYVRADRAKDFGVPPGHMPPPGQCRVWYPDRPPGQQPPPSSCGVSPPRGAVLIEG